MNQLEFGIVYCPHCGGALGEAAPAPCKDAECISAYQPTWWVLFKNAVLGRGRVLKALDTRFATRKLCDRCAVDRRKKGLLVEQEDHKRLTDEES